MASLLGGSPHDVRMVLADLALAPIGRRSYYLRRPRVDELVGHHASSRAALTSSMHLCPLRSVLACRWCLCSCRCAGPDLHRQYLRWVYSVAARE
eukprot:11164815-Lingulodinium_polyedra.AAC.1